MFPHGDYEFCHAADEDVSDLFRDVFSLFGNPEKFLRKLDERDVEQLIQAGYLWFVKHRQSGTIAATAFVKVAPPTQTECPPAELGGIYVVENHRKMGIAKRLSALALGAYLLDNESTEETDPTPVVAHVHISNPDPRPLLTEKLGFELMREVEVPPDAPGFEEMPKVEGTIKGDEFELTDEGKAQALRLLHELANETDLGVEEYKSNDVIQMAEHYESKGK